MAAVVSPLENLSIPGVKAEGALLHSMRAEVAKLLVRKNQNFPGAQPVSFSRRHLEELKREDYYVCEKSDGMRYLLYLTEDDLGEEIHYLIDRKNDYWFLPKLSLHFPVPRDVEGFHINTLIDGELVLDKVPGGGLQPKYLVFDCLVLDGNSLMTRTLDKRLAYFQERIFTPYKALLREYPDEIRHMHFLVEMKSMQLSYAIDMMFKQILPSLAHGNDGLIFTCRTSDYQHGTDHNILKWKPEAENSIDFRLSLDIAMIQPDEQDIADGITAPYPDYDAMPIFHLMVFAGDGREDPVHGTMYVEPEEWESLKSLKEPLDDRIVECFMDSQKRWRYMRFRDDKSQANHTSTVASVIESITDRVTEKDLIAAAPAIRTEWKRREAERVAKEKKEAERKRVASEGVNSNGPAAGTKRKADEQGDARPSPGPPGKN